MLIIGYDFHTRYQQVAMVDDATGYAHNTAFELTGFNYANGVTATFGYSLDRLQLNCLDYSTTNRNGSCTHDSTTKFGLDYSYGAAGSNNGQIQSITDNVDAGRSVTFSYDNLARLEDPEAKIEVYVAWRREEQSTVTLAFLDSVRRVFRTQAHREIA